LDEEIIMSIAPWFPDWLRARAETRGETTGGGPTWSELHDELGPDGCGVLYVLLTIAHGRRVFDADPADVLALLAMDRGRFSELVLELVQRGLIEVSVGGDTMGWTIVRTPQGWAQ